MVKMALMFVSLGLLLVGGFGLFYNDVKEVENIEDISSYEIKDRYECKQILDNKEYNNCIKFYLDKDPYKLGEELVPTRLMK